MAKIQPVLLQPGFLDIRERRGLLFLVPPKRIVEMSALTLICHTVSNNFGLYGITVLLRDPQKALTEHTKQEIRTAEDILREDGRHRQTAIYVNTADVIRRTIRFTEGMGFRTLFIDLNSELFDTKEVVRRAILKILKET